MSARKKTEPRVVTIAEIERTFTLVSYWWGSKWCPAVKRNENGTYTIRVLRGETRTEKGDGTVNVSTRYDHFEIEADGVIDSAPRGWAKTFRPGQVADIQTWVERYATPDPTATRINIGGAW